MFLTKNNKKNDNLVKITALLIHAAKIDENYSVKEREIIKEAILKLGANSEEIKTIMTEGEKMEENSNQILEFTQEIKRKTEDEKIKIIEILWKIIYSNKEADIYETSLMRRLTGLLYIDSKTAGNIKDRIKNENPQ
tara:strand:- start:107 stop:517 length:411 start_codon:yes stop_codon:yes gene_type:complete